MLLVPGEERLVCKQQESVLQVTVEPARQFVWRTEVKGVRSVRCTFESNQAVIALEDATALPEAERAITKLGYSITPAPGSQPPAQPAASR